VNDFRVDWLFGEQMVLNVVSETYNIYLASDHRPWHIHQGFIIHNGGSIMVSLETPVCEFGKPAIDFSLPGVDGKQWTLQDCLGEKGLLVMFICNHCPYVKAVRERIVRDTNELKNLGINSVAIMSNDPALYDEDSFENMKKVSEQYGFSFPYLLDETQEVARAYGAVCTPDFFGYNANLELQYRGRLDASRKETAPPDVRRDLFEGMVEVARTGKGPKDQIPSMGCSIKWQE
jgi:peroxiredoxin